MKRFVLNIIATFVPVLIYAQNYTSVLKGTIIDKDSRQPLYGVNVSVTSVNPVIGASTDDKGFFMIRNLPTGRVNIKMSYIGYEDAYLSQILIGTGKETNVNIELQEKVNNIKEVVVNAGKDKSRANNSFATVSAMSFSVEETKRYAGTLNDPSRMVQTFPEWCQQEMIIMPLSSVATPPVVCSGVWRAWRYLILITLPGLKVLPVAE